MESNNMNPLAKDKECGIVAGQQLADRTIAKPNEIPQTEKMLPISQILDDRNEPIADHWQKSLTNGDIAAVLVEVDGKELFLQPKGMNGMEVQVPSHAHFVRDEATQEQILRLRAVGGGSK